MGRARVFFIKRRISTLFRRVFRRRSLSKAYIRLEPPQEPDVTTLSNLISRLRTTVKAVLTRKYLLPVPKHTRPRLPEPAPKGHVPVHVGRKNGDFEKVFVPVVYLNHPLFGDLLKESEKEFGFHHPGGITIPCRISEFESVRTRIEAVQRYDKVWTWKRRMCKQY